MNKHRIVISAIVASLIFNIIPFFSTSAIEAEFTNSKITISREIIEASEPITNTFTYQITPDSGNPGTVSGAPSSASITFDDVDPDADGRATKSGEIDFIDAVFPEMGSYIFNIKEVSSSNADDYPIIDNIEFHIIVNIGYPVDEDGIPDNSRIVANVLKTAKKTVDGVTKTDKYRVLWSLDDHSDDPEPPETTFVGIHSEIIGTIPNLNPQCFAFSIELPASGFSDDDRFILMTRKTVDGEPSACASSVGKGGNSGSRRFASMARKAASGTLSSSVTLVSGDGNYEVIPGGKTIFKLAQNEVAYIEIPVGTEYAFARVDTTGIDYDDKYTTKFDGKFANSIIKTAAAITFEEFKDMLSSRTPSSNISFVQLTNKDNVITGIIANSWPFLVLVLMVIGGAVTIVILNRRKKDNEKIKK